jgi:hypothetical protein
MRHFVPQEYSSEFESLRGTETLRRIIMEEWTEKLEKHPKFRRSEKVEERYMSIEEEGLATGVFRMPMLERYSFPAYFLDKTLVTFPEPLESNLQFRKLFLPVWRKWNVQIRPTASGFFVFQLKRRYEGGARSLLDLSRDVLRLQAPFDVPSAIRWRKKVFDEHPNEPEILAKTERSICSLLNWLGVGDSCEADAEPRILYYPVQWKLAIEAANLLVDDVNLELKTSFDSTIVLRKAGHNISFAPYDSYIIHYFDEMVALPSRARKKPLLVGPREIRESKRIRNALTSLLEGTVLYRTEQEGADPAGGVEKNTYWEFPTPRWSRSDSLFMEPSRNLGTWSDEICIIGPRTALIIPSKRWREHSLSVSTMPGSIKEVTYLRYWESIERMIEFVVEISVLARLIEGESYKLLSEMADTVEKIRGGMFRGNIEIDNRLQEQVIRAAHLRRIASLVQNLSHAAAWSRAEYAVEKARHLFEELDVPNILEHVQRNIDSINAVADHIDELYFTDLSEKNNENTTLLSVALAALSFVLTLIALPSFGADWWTVAEDDLKLPHSVLWSGLIVGVILSFLVVAASLLFLAKVRRNWRTIWQILNRFLE